MQSRSGMTSGCIMSSRAACAGPAIRFQINVQLIDAESGVHLWADLFDTDRRELAKAQAEITVRLARMLQQKLVAAEITRSEQRKAVDPDARDFVMRGR